MKKSLLAVASGALAALSFPTPGLWPLAFVAWVPLLVALREASIREGMLRGALAGATFFGIVLRWIAPLSLVGFVALIVYLAAFFALFGAVAAHLRGRSRLAIPFAFVALEWTRGWAFGGFGWASLGYALPASLAGLAAYGGVPLLSLSVFVVNYALAEASLRKVVWAPLVLLLAGNLRSPRTDGSLRVAAINAALDPRTRTGDPLSAHATLTDGIASARPDLYVWPETALPAPLDPPGAIPIRTMSLSRRVREVWGAPLLLGVPAPAERGVFNAGALVDGEHATIVYRKRRLVPLGEVDFAGLPRVLPGPPIAPADRATPPLAIAGARVGVLICFEDLFAEDALARAKEADVLVVLTNDVWLGAAGAEQHLAVTTMRALESGRAIVRAANSGATTVLDARGRPLVPTTTSSGAIVADAPRSTEATPFARAPDLLPFVAWAATLAALALRQRREVGEVDGLLESRASVRSSGRR